jgi:uncharacterized ion transporter superfamily protein YfcC
MRMKLPHPLVLLLGCVVVAVVLTWVLPAGQYDRRFGVALAISTAMQEGLILDTILNGLVPPLANVPAVVAALLMVPMHTLLHFAVPSVSGQAALTMPIMVPLADLIGLSRDAAVIAYQTGAGISDMFIPTNGALLAMLLAARVSFNRWLRFALPGSLLVALVGLLGVILAG